MEDSIKSKLKFAKNAIQIIWPAVLESLLISTVGIVDTFMVSSLGSYAVAAVGISTQPKLVGLTIFMSVNIAVTALVARKKGEKDYDGVNQILLVSLMIVIVAGTIISLLFFVFAEKIVVLAGGNKETVLASSQYLKIIMGCIVFHLISLAINAVQRGLGNTKIAMKSNMVSNIVNLFGNYVLINGYFGFPKLGIRGSAIACVLGTIAAMCMSIHSIINPGNQIGLMVILKNKIQIQKKSVYFLLNMGIPIFMEQGCIRVGFFLSTLMVAGFGTSVMAAHQIGMNLMGICYAFGDGLSVSIVALSGRCLGEGNEKSAIEYRKICTIFAVCISIVLAVFFRFNGRMIFTLFLKDNQAQVYGVKIVFIMSMVILVQLLQAVFLGFLRGAGDNVFIMLVSIVSVMFFRPFAGYLFGYHLKMGIEGIWIGMLCDQILRVTLFVYRYNSNKWKRILV